MNVLHISTKDYEGAGVAAYKFHRRLSDQGYNSRLLVLYKRNIDETVKRVKYGWVRSRIHRLFEKIEDKLGVFDPEYAFSDRGRYAVGSATELEPYIDAKPDVIILYWVSKFVDLRVAYQLKMKYGAKVYWYLMDMAPMTGGCHYKWDCQEFAQQCKNCPATRSLRAALPAKIFRNKYEVLKKMDISLLYTVPWIRDLLNQSTLFNNSEKLFMPVVFDEALFNISEVSPIREKYKLPHDKFIVLYGAVRTDERRKGFEYFMAALKNYQEKYPVDNVMVVTIGSVPLEMQQHDITIPYRHLGTMETQEDLADMYKMSDVFVSPVIEDIGPSMVIESMLCGTPVVAFDVGVAKDIVKHRESGYIARKGDSEAITEGIKFLADLEKEGSDTFAQNCRSAALRFYSHDRHKEQVAKFLSSLD